MKGSNDVFCTVLRGALLAFFALAIATPANAESILVVSGIFGGGIQAFDANTGASLGTFANPGSQVSGLATLPNGNLAAAVYTHDNPTIYQYSPNGTNLGVFATAAGIILNIKTGPDGNLYVFDEHDTGDAVDEYNGTTGAFMGTVMDPTTYYDPAFAVAPNGNFAVAPFGSISLFNGSELQGNIGADTVSAHIMADSAGDLYWSSLGYGSEANGIWECPGCESGTGTPFQLVSYTDGLGGMIIGPDGQLLVTHNDQVLAFNLSTGAPEGVFATSSGLSSGYEMALLNTSENPTTSTPEPATLFLFGAGLTALARRLRSLQGKTAK